MEKNIFDLEKLLWKKVLDDSIKFKISKSTIDQINLLKSPLDTIIKIMNGQLLSFKIQNNDIELREYLNDPPYKNKSLGMTDSFVKIPYWSTVFLMVKKDKKKANLIFGLSTKIIEQIYHSDFSKVTNLLGLDLNLGLRFQEKNLMTMRELKFQKKEYLFPILKKKIIQEIVFSDSQ